MTTVLQSVLEKLSEDLNIQVRSYSGRGMYGKSCLAFTTDRYTQLGSVFAGVLRTIAGCFSDSETERLAEAFEGMCSDSMGLGMVYYFPDVEYCNPSEEEEEEEEED